MEKSQSELENRQSSQQGANIRVVGVGGGGCNAIDRMIVDGLSGVEFIACNTDHQVLDNSHAPVKVQVGRELTKGLGVGSDPELGRKAMEESRREISDLLEGSDMVFVTCGMGGGTGTGGAPIVAEVAKEQGILTVGIVTKPFSFEGKRRMRQAEEGIEEMYDRVDSLIVIPNNRLLSMTERKTPLQEAFEIADQVLKKAVTGITELILEPGLINLDFADVKTIMKDSGKALIGLGNGTGEERALDAVTEAMESPLLESSVEGASGVLLNFVGSEDLTLQEVNQAADAIHNLADSEANIIFGAQIDQELEDEVKVMVLATGFAGGSGERSVEDVLDRKRRRRSESREQSPQKESGEDGDESSLREGSPASDSPLDRDSGEPDEDEEDLDIPTYLRKDRNQF